MTWGVAAGGCPRGHSGDKGCRWLNCWSIFRGSRYGGLRGGWGQAETGAPTNLTPEMSVQTWRTARGYYRMRIPLQVGPEPTPVGTAAGRDCGREKPFRTRTPIPPTPPLTTTSRIT